MAAGNLWAGQLPIDDATLTAIILPMGLVGAGFAFAVSAVTAAVVETVPHSLAGMASATTSMLRDFGFTLGPAVIGAIATAKATGLLSSGLASANLSAADSGQAHGILSGGGPIAVLHADANTTVKGIAHSALGTAYGLGFTVAGLAALVCAVVAVTLLRGSAEETAAEFDPAAAAATA
jgi:hypothetical protein